MKTIVGTIVSSKMTKSATVVVTQTWTHPKYKKTIKKSKRYLVQNDIGALEGDTVELTESRPLSHKKRFTIKNLVKKSE